MRILLLTTGCFDKGGVSRFSRYQTSALRKIYGSQNVRVLSLLGPDEHAIEEPFDVTWHGSKFGMADKLKMVFAAMIQCARWRPDIVLSAHLSLAPLTVLLSRMFSAKSVLNIYGLEVWSNPRKSALWALRSTDHVIADCLSTQDYVVENRLRQKPLHKIWDCVDTNRFQPGECPQDVMARYGLPDPKKFFLIMTLGRIAKSATHKGYHRLLHAFSVLRPKFPEARLVVCGRGDMLDDLKTLALDLHVSDEVTFTGAIDEEHLKVIYRAASVFSLVSEKGNGRGEGIPMTPMEAMACGVPIVVGNQDGSRELIVEGNGFVIDPFANGQHVDCFMKLKDDQFHKHSASQARKIAENVFSYDRFVAEHKQLFESI